MQPAPHLSEVVGLRWVAIMQKSMQNFCTTLMQRHAGTAYPLSFFLASRDDRRYANGKYFP
jgi:hypothetical protein